MDTNPGNLFTKHAYRTYNDNPTNIVRIKIGRLRKFRAPLCRVPPTVVPRPIVPRHNNITCIFPVKAFIGDIISPRGLFANVYNSPDSRPGSRIWPFLYANFDRYVTHVDRSFRTTAIRSTRHFANLL